MHVYIFALHTDTLKSAHYMTQTKCMSVCIANVSLFGLIAHTPCERKRRNCFYYYSHAHYGNYIRI